MSRASETSYGYTLRKELRALDVYVSIFEPTNLAKLITSTDPTQHALPVVSALESNLQQEEDVIPTSPTTSEVSSASGESGIFSVGFKSSSSRSSSPAPSPKLHNRERRPTEVDFSLQKDRRRSSLLIPCLKLSEEESTDEVLEELVNSITNPIEPPLFISLKHSSFKYTLN